MASEHTPFINFPDCIVAYHGGEWWEDDRMMQSELESGEYEMYYRGEIVDELRAACEAVIEAAETIHADWHPVIAKVLAALEKVRGTDA